MTHLAQLQAEAEVLFATLLQYAGATEGRDFTATEDHLVPQVQALGALLMRVFLEAEACRHDVAGYVHDGCAYGAVGRRDRTLATRFGVVRWLQPCARPVQRRSGRALDFPADRAMAIKGHFSAAVMGLMLHLCSQMAFGQSRALFRRLHGYAPAPQSVLRMVDAAGPAAEAFLEQVQGPESLDDLVLGIFVDARGAATVTETELYRRRKPHGPRGAPKGNLRHRRKNRRKLAQRPRRTAGQKSKNAKGVVVGVLVLWRRLPDGTLEGPVRKHVCSSLLGHRDLFQKLHAIALRFGYTVIPSYFYADGLPHIWELSAEFFSKATPCIDIVHVLERIWQCGETHHKPGTPGLQAFVHRQHRRLLDDHVHLVLAELQKMLDAIPRSGPGNAGKRERLTDNLRYLRNNQNRMPYKHLLEEDLDIGTGVVEGAVRHLVAIRLDGCGMRWGLDRLRQVLALRTIFINGTWDAFEKGLHAKTIRLAPYPQKARPHVATPRTAA